jgi:putative two-component system response regulator
LLLRGVFARLFSLMTTQSTQIRKSVLVVDDEETILQMAKRYVVNAGYEPVLARGAEEAFKAVAKHVPDLVLLDVMMPDMTGFELCRRFREDVRLKKVPIIIVTALHSKSDEETAINSGANEFVVKPIGGQDMEAKLRRYLGSPFKAP